MKQADLQLPHTIQVAILASGTGSNAVQLIRYCKANPFPFPVRWTLISDRPDAPVLEKARQEGADCYHFPYSAFKSGQVLRFLKARRIGFVVMAGFLRLLPSEYIAAWPRRVINLHPALLPLFGGKGMFGMNVHRAVVEAGMTETGITIHYANEHYDQGDIIRQERCLVNPTDTPEDVAANIHALEHTFFPLTIHQLISQLPENKMKTVLITGATSGIGKATAELLAANSSAEAGFRLVLCGRRADRLAALASELSVLTQVHTLCFDVRDKEAVFQQIESLPEPFRQVDVLINNAGNAHGLAPFDQGDLADWEAMLDINVKGLMYVSKAIVPGMVARQSGHIINIGSVAGKEAYPNGNGYNASKFAVDGLSQAMRMDLFRHGIRVGAINPGLVETEFSLVRFKGDAERAKTVYQGLQPLTPEDIADLILFTITRPPHVNLTDMLVFPSAQASSTLVDRGK